MQFKPIEYMEWAKKIKGAKHNFCRSGVAGLSLKDLAIQPENLEIFGENAYGYPPLIQAVAGRYGVQEENVMLTLGTSHALFLVCAALLSAGDSVLVEKPAYEPLRVVPQAFGANVLRFERPFEMGYSVNCDEYKRNLSPEVKLVLLTNLHNPSGAWLSPHILEEMAVRAKSEKAALVVDEIYLEFLESQTGHTSFHLGDNIIVISSLTKVFGLGDLRCGWVLASPDVVRKMKIIQDHSIVEGVFISEWISAGIFERLDAFREKNEFRIRANLSEIKSFIEDQDFLDWVEPAGGVICFPRINTGLTGDDLARILDAEFDIAIVPGSLFEDERHFRLGFDADPDDLAFALETIRRILNRY